MGTGVRPARKVSRGNEDSLAERAEPVRFGSTLGVSPSMRRLYPVFERLAGGSDPLVIEGEPGTGKELLAEALYDMGPRAMEPFVVFDCARGAREFARPHGDRDKAFEELLWRTAGGTLLLDELGKLDRSLQGALARVLSRYDADVRILVTTRADLELLVREGVLREDLYARVAVEHVALPPLRAREGDVAYLARHFWLEGGGDKQAFPAADIARAEAYPWPGNVRELRDFVQKLLAPNGDDLDGVVAAVLEAEVSYAEARRRLLLEFEQRYVQRMLTVHHGNITRAAAASGLARRNFQLIRARRRDGS
jgi:DNA-binding NtrC family response regulator